MDKNKRKNGEGTIIELPDHRFRMVKQVGYLPNGHPRRITVTGTSVTDCIKKMKQREASDVNIIEDPEIRKITLTELCMMHFDADLSQKDLLKPKSADRRESTIKNQIGEYSIGRMQAVNVRSANIKAHIEKLINETDLSVSSIEKALNVINAAYKWAVSQDLLNCNPCKAVLRELKNRLKQLKIKNSADGIVYVLSNNQFDIIDEYVSMLNYHNAQTYRRIFGLSVKVLMWSGMRVGELCALRWEDYYENEKVLTIDSTRNVVKNREGSGTRYNENAVKNYHARTIELLDEAQKAIDIIKEISPKTQPDDYIMLNSRFNPLNPSNYDDDIKRFYARAGLPQEITGAHILRRTFCTQRCKEGWPIEKIAAYIGDLPATVYKHYISVTEILKADDKILNVVKIPKKDNM